MASNEFPRYPNVYVIPATDHENDWAFRDVYDRILTGQLLDPQEAAELFQGFLEDGDIRREPADLIDRFETDADGLAAAIVRGLWDAAHDTASAWRSDITDTDRFYRAVFNLHDDADIFTSIFGSIFDIDGYTTMRGVAALAADAWRQFDASAPVEITLAIDSRRLDTLISAIAIDVADAFEHEGLKATINDDYSVTVTAQWRHHVLSNDEALEAASHIPGSAS